MQFYVNLKGKELIEFLEGGNPLALAENADDDWHGIIHGGCLPVFLISLGAFKNARVAMSREEFKTLNLLPNRKAYLFRIYELTPVVKNPGYGTHSFEEAVRKMSPDKI